MGTYLLTRIASSTSSPEVSVPGSPKSVLSKKSSRSILRAPLSQPTIVYSVHPSPDEDEKSVVEVTLETSPSASGASSGNSGKSSMPRNDSTGMTSLESKLSLTAGQSSENRKTVSKPMVDEETIAEAPLEPIQEVARELPPDPVPSKRDC